MKKEIIIFLLPVFLLGSDFSELFKKANKNAENSEYIEAIRGYELLLEKGHKNRILYYNLGNAYYRNNQLGLALWAYYRAQRLMPRDPDLLHNIKVAKAKCVDRIEYPKSLIFFDLFLRIKNSIKFSELTIIGSFLFFIGSILVVVKKTKLVSSKLINYLISFFIILFFLSCVLSISRYKFENNEKYGVVISNSINVFSGPVENQNSILFLINEGLKVKLNNFQDKWVEVQLIDGKKGWVNIWSIREI